MTVEHFLEIDIWQSGTERGEGEGGGELHNNLDIKISEKTFFKTFKYTGWEGFQAAGKENKGV